MMLSFKEKELARMDKQLDNMVKFIQDDLGVEMTRDDVLTFAVSELQRQLGYLIDDDSEEGKVCLANLVHNMRVHLGFQAARYFQLGKEEWER